MSFLGLKNLYLCESCGHGFVTQDVDTGTTPFITTCVREECKGAARSFFYKVPQEWLKDVPPVLEWYHPSDADLAGMAPHIRNHVAQFGLISRRREKEAT